jgi:hypothetical protein
MSAPKLTPWFPGYIKPVRPGVYEVFWYMTPVYAKFDNFRWHQGADRDLNCAAAMLARAHNEPSKWRGLAEQPK